jgi:hypothetical protein
MKAYYGKDSRFKKFPGNRILYPVVERDPVTGLRFQTNTEYLTPGQMDSCKELRSVIDNNRARYVKGLNTALVEELNSTYASRLWKFSEIALYQDGIFGKSKIEHTAVLFQDFTTGKLMLAIEEMEYYESSSD